jgi:prolyl-tRNA synthetase
MADGAPVIAVIRGDDTLNEAKLQMATGAAMVRPAQADEVFALMGAHPGSLGAVRLTVAPVLVDQSLVGRTNLVTGANRDGFHVRGVDLKRDLLEGSHARLVDLRTARSGERCPACEGVLESFPALEVGHIFKLGTRYTERLGATIVDSDGSPVPIVMGSYGIGLGRLLAAVVEQHHDADGIIWPVALAPFDVAVLTLGGEPELAPFAEHVVRQLDASGLDVLHDDRDERAGVKFKDADLIGIPLRIGVGRRQLAAGAVEAKLRWEPGVDVVRLEDLASRARDIAGRTC